MSKDEDFHQRALVDGPLPKVIWVRLGNCSTNDIKQGILRSHDFIVGFVEDEETSFLSLE
ncbi:hypothetical protein BH23ACT4_BH23ACT4_06590 [soil metagenome]